MRGAFSPWPKVRLSHNSIRYFRLIADGFRFVCHLLLLLRPRRLYTYICRYTFDSLSFVTPNRCLSLRHRPTPPPSYLFSVSGTSISLDRLYTMYTEIFPPLFIRILMNIFFFLLSLDASRAHNVGERELGREKEREREMIRYMNQYTSVTYNPSVYTLVYEKMKKKKLKKIRWVLKNYCAPMKSPSFVWIFSRNCLQLQLAITL